MLSQTEGERVLKLCLNGSLKEVEKCADANAAVINAADAEGNTALHLASWKGHLPVVKFLLSNNVLVNSKNTSGMTPLHLACHNAHLEITSALLHAKADPLSCSSLGVTPLDVAAGCGKIELLQRVLAAVRVKQIDLNSVGFPEVTRKLPFLSSACLKSDVEACRALLQFGVEVNSVDCLTQTTPLMLAATRNNSEVVDLLLQWGADAQETCLAGFCALDFAAFHSSPSVGLLASKSAVKIVVVNEEEDGVFSAVKNGDVLAVQRILSGSYPYGSLVNERSADEGATPLMYAVLVGRLELVQLLVGYGADVNAQDLQSGWTALMQAIFHSQWAIAKYLIQIGCDVTLQAFNGCTAIDLVYMVEAEHDDLAFLRLLSTVHQKQSDSKLLRRRAQSAWRSNNSAKEGLKAWWNRVSDRFKNIKWSSATAKPPSAPKRKKNSAVHPFAVAHCPSDASNVWQNSTFSPFPGKNVEQKPAKFFEKSREKMRRGFRGNRVTSGNNFGDSGVGSLQEHLSPLFPAFEATFGAESQYLSPSGHRGSVGSVSGMVLRKPSWKHQSKSMQNLCSETFIDDLGLQHCWKSVNDLKLILKKFNLESYLPLLREHEVDMESLRLLDTEDLSEMGIKPEDRGSFLDMIKSLKSDGKGNTHD